MIIDVRKTFSGNLRYYRKKAGYKQLDLGKKLKVDTSTVSLWETGKNTPSLENVGRISDVLGVKPYKLFVSHGCENCGLALEIGYKFCPNCGKGVEE